MKTSMTIHLIIKRFVGFRFSSVCERFICAKDCKTESFDVISIHGFHEMCIAHRTQIESAAECSGLFEAFERNDKRTKKAQIFNASNVHCTAAAAIAQSFLSLIRFYGHSISSIRIQIGSREYFSRIVVVQYEQRV